MSKRMLKTIGAKVAASMLAITILVIVIAISSYILSIRTEDNTRIVAESDIPSAILSISMLDEIGDMNANVLEYALGESEEKQVFEENYREFLGFFARLKEASVVRKRRLNEVDRLFNEYSHRARTEIFERYDPESEGWARLRVKALTEITGTRLENLLDELKESEIADAGQTPSFDEVVNDDLPGVRYYLELVDEAGDMVNNLTQYINGVSTAKEQFFQDSQTFEVFLSQLKPLEQRAAEVEALTEVQALYTVLRDGGIEVFQRYNPQNKQAAIQAIDRLEHEVFQRLEQLLDDISSQASDVASASLFELRELTENNILIMSGLVAIVILFCLLMVYYAYRSVISPITDLIYTMQCISSGDINQTVEYQDRNDEIGSMAESIEVFKVNLIARVEAEQALLDAKDKAEGASRAKASFLATMSHEIRTPMNGVIGMIDLMMESSMTQDQRSIMKTVRDSSFSLLNIINDILDFSKIEAGKLELENVAFDLNSVVESVVDTMQISAREKRVCLDLHTDLNIPLELIGDPLRLRQVIFNLVSNAIKFSAEAGQVGRVQIRTQLLSTEGHQVLLQFQVQDNGIGIRKEELDKLFLPFTQAEFSTTRRFGGTGLGLAICHNLVALMGGKISIESHYGHGATFNVNLPLSVGKHKETLKFDGGNLVLLLDINDNTLRDLCQEYSEHLAIESLLLGVKALQQSLVLQYLDQGVFVILIKDHVEPCALDSLYARYNHFKQLILLESNAINPGTVNGHTYTLEGHPLKATGLIWALNVLLGRQSPCVEVEKDCTQTIETPASIQEAEQQGRLILVAEDNLVNQDVISRQLKTLGYLCIVAADGIEAERMYELHQYSMILTDCHMPRRDGYELAKILKKKQKEQGNFIPVIAITANALLGESEKCYDAGMDDYLAKPVELSKLRQALDQWSKKRNFQADVIKTEDSAASLLNEKIILDDSVLESIYGGELDDYRDSLKDFQLFVLPNVALLGEYITVDLNTLKAKLHQYKSPAKAVGVSLLAVLLEEIEALCLDDPTSLKQIEQHINHLQQILPEIDKVITEKINSLK